MYINTTVKARRLQDNGVYKPVSEKYLISAISFAEAEEKAINLPDVGKTDNLEAFRLSIRDKYQDLITKHTTESFAPSVLLIFEENER